ncbi:nuclease-related domain-containing protein [Streptomyces sp. NPDC001178]
MSPNSPAERGMFTPATLGSRPDAGASARQIADLVRAAERRAQHRRAKDAVPLIVAFAALGGSGIVSYTNWQTGLATTLGLAVLPLWYLYHPTHKSSWAKGAAGEQKTARLLKRLERRGHIVLHDRAVPGSRANLDHLVIGPAGVTYIDTKAWRSKRSTLTLEEGTLRLDGYAKARAVDTVLWEAQQAAQALGCPVHPVIAVHGAKLPALHGRLETRGVTIVEAKRLPGLLRDLPPQPEWTTARITAVQQRAHHQLPSHGG